MAQGKAKVEGREETSRVCSAPVSFIGACKECWELPESSGIMDTGRK